MRVVLHILIVGAVVACGAAVGDPAAPDTGCALWEIRVTPASASLHAGDTVRVTAAVNQCGGLAASTAVHWRSSDSTIATVDSLSGLVRARAQGPSTIIATLVADPAVRGAMALTVIP